MHFICKNLNNLVGHKKRHIRLNFPESNLNSFQYLVFEKFNLKITWIQKSSSMMDLEKNWM